MLQSFSQFVLALLLATLAGCGGGSSGDAGRPVAPQLAGGSGWTSLGSRSRPSQADKLATASGGTQWKDYDPPVLYPGTVNQANQFITMDDGVRLAANVSRPTDAAGKVEEAPLPVIVTLTTYNKDVANYAPILGGAVLDFVQRGYVHVTVDVRGTGRSDGQWEAFSAREQQDYNQVLDWVVAQPWSNGRLAMLGTSAPGITSMLTAAKQHPALKAVFAIVPMGDAYRDVVAVGGQGSFAFLTGWLSVVTALSVVNPTLHQAPDQYFAAIAEHVQSALTNFQYPTLVKALIGDPGVINDGEFWGLRSPVEQADKVQVPVFIVGGLHDVFQRGEPLLYEALKNHTTTKLLLGPWDHLQAAVGKGLPTDGVPVLNHIALNWFDHFLKGQDNGAERLPKVTQWVWGADHYFTRPDWPHPQARAQRLFLGGDGSISEHTPAAGAAPRVTLQQPVNGICSQSATQATLGIMGLTQLPCFSDDRVANALEIVYETEPLTEDLYLDGPIQTDLWVSTTAQDAGLVVRVADVAPDGTAFNLSNGMLQVSLRAVDPAKSRYLDGQMIQPWHPFTVESKAPPGSGEIVPVAVEVWPTSALIKQGHRLRVAVGPSNFPAGLPGLPDLLASLAGVLSVHSDAEHPSSVVLPVVPASLLH